MQSRARKTQSQVQDAVVTRLADNLRRKYGCHTVILYGSRARADHAAESDYDLVGIGQQGPVRHLAQRVGRAYVDAFVYPERKATPSELLRIRGGRVVFQKARFGEGLLERIDRLHARGPKTLSSDEITLRKLWAQKMIDRAKRADLEGHFRRAELLTVLLEDYFVLRGMWYEGPKMSLKWLRDHEPQIAALFARALQTGARLSQIAKLAAAVTTITP
jgi:predicted nucleotidyltransferase